MDSRGTSQQEFDVNLSKMIVFILRQYVTSNPPKPATTKELLAAIQPGAGEAKAKSKAKAKTK